MRNFRSLHATLVKWCQNINVIDVRIGKTFSIVDQQHRRIVENILCQLVMVSITVVHQKIENGSVNQIEQSA